MNHLITTPKNKSHLFLRSGGRKRAFTRLDMVVLVGTVVILVSWFALTRIGEHGRTLRCAAHLATLGKAMHGYLNEHQDALPFGEINLGKNQSSWDTQIFPYLSSGLAKASSEKLAETVPKFFKCPSDQAAHQGTVRSYAMGGNDMAPANWPPGPESATGVGLWWDKRTVPALLGEDALQKPDTLPVVKRSDIPAPASTLLLTEFVGPNNMVGSIRQTVVFGAAQQRQFFEDGGATFHRGKFNYLMMDGHVESLSPLQTGSFDGTAGIWSIKKEN